MIKDRRFLLLILFNIISNGGDVFYIASMVYFLFSATNSVLDSSLIPISVTIGIFVSGLFSNYLYRNFKTRNIVLINLLLKVINVLILSILISYIDIKFIYLFILVNSFFDGFTNPVYRYIIPVIVEKRFYDNANSLISVVNNVVQIVGWSLVSILSYYFSLNFIIYIILILYIVSLFVFYFIEYREYEDKDLLSKNTVYSEFITMVKFNISSKTNRYFNFITIINSFIAANWLSTVIMAHLKSVINKEEYWFGILNSSFFLGILFGGLIYFRLSSKLPIKYKNNIMIYLSLILAVIAIIYGFSELIYLSLFIILFYGILDEIYLIALNTKIQTNISESYLLKFYTFNGIIYTVGFAISTFIIAYITDFIDVRIVFIISTLLLILSFILNTRNSNNS